MLKSNCQLAEYQLAPEKESSEQIPLGSIVDFTLTGRCLFGRVVLGITQGPQGPIPIAVPGTVRVEYLCPVRGVLGDVQLPMDKVRVVKRIEQLELFDVGKHK